MEKEKGDDWEVVSASSKEVSSPVPPEESPPEDIPVPPQEPPPGREIPEEVEMPQNAEIYTMTVTSGERLHRRNCPMIRKHRETRLVHRPLCPRCASDGITDYEQEFKFSLNLAAIFT